MIKRKMCLGWSGKLLALYVGVHGWNRMHQAQIVHGPTDQARQNFN